MNHVVLAVVVGLCMGSFLNVCTLRWPQGGSVISPPSSCPQCGRGIKWYENIPVFSWLFLGGKCAGCSTSISIQYPVIELLTGIIWGLSVYYYSISFTALNLAVYATVMLGITVTDLRNYVIPDGFTVFGVVWLFLAAIANFLLQEPTVFASVYPAFIGACTGAGLIAIVGWIGEIVLKKEAMGFGDVTLMAVAGAAVGPERAVLTVFIGAAIGVLVFTVFVLPYIAIVNRPKRPGGNGSDGDGEDESDKGIPLVPFGVFLAPASVITLLYGNQLIEWYLDLLVL